MIKINSLQKYFNRGKTNEIHVLDGVSLDLPERGMVAIFGRSGCGKTTLLNVIGGLDGYLSGSVEIDGEKITPDSDALRNRHIGYIFQNYNLNLTANCFDNVADALRLCGMSDKKDGDVIRERTMSALSAVGMAQYAQRYPETLSGGQKQRIAIARAIVKSPDIILADEPTGNLDETNTVMIMDILREIADSRLVLLVTHEANLVDSYCDRVIGITDGRVTSVKDNDVSAGYTAKNKNHIYLGELEKSSANAGSLTVDYFGAPADKDIKLTLVNHDGKIFLRVDTPGVHIIDEYGETKLHEGVFEKKEGKTRQSKIDLSLLTPFEGKDYGRLFSFFTSLKSGSRILTGKKIKKGKKRLKTSSFFAASYLVCFALVFTVLLSLCASGIAVYDTLDETINPNIFQLSLEDIDTEKLSKVISSPDACIDYMYETSFMNTSGVSISVTTGSFETFYDYGYSDAYSANVPGLPHSLIGDAEVISGDISSLGEYDLVLSKETADAILKTAVYDYIASYDDLINCTVRHDSHSWTVLNVRIAAIVDTGELAAYYDPMTLFSIQRERNGALSVIPASKYGLDIPQGEAWIGGTMTPDYLPKTGEIIKINGVELTATKIETGNGIYLYHDWLKQNKYPSNRGDSYEDLEEYYSRLDEYAVWQILSQSESYGAFLYLCGDSQDARFLVADDFEYFAACRYRDQHGSFPTEESEDFAADEYFDEWEKLKIDADEYFYNNMHTITRYNPTVVYLSDGDFSRVVSSYGETHPVADPEYFYSGVTYGKGAQTLVMHSSDPEATEAYLREQFPELPSNDPKENFRQFITPEYSLNYAIEEKKSEITASAIALIVGTALMCICIYFIMRSSMLGRVREIGIYRAIGVSRKNLIFRFAVESTAIAIQTLLIGFILGAIIANSLATGGVTSMMFYFPFWLGALTLAFLIGTCILFGILPAAGLLRRTPAEILAKYDI